jgi:hypothetical protein
MEADAFSRSLLGGRSARTRRNPSAALNRPLRVGAPAGADMLCAGETQRKTPAGKDTDRGWHCRKRWVVGLSRRRLAELQGLRHDGLLVMTNTAAQAERRRNNDRASYKDTHGLSPVFPRFYARLYGLLPEKAVTLGIHIGSKRSA